LIAFSGWWHRRDRIACGAAIERKWSVCIDVAAATTSE